MSKLVEFAVYGGASVLMGYVCFGQKTGWVKPGGWVGYYPSSSGEAIAHPARSPECDLNHTYPCPKKECRGYQVPTSKTFYFWW